MLSMSKVDIVKKAMTINIKTCEMPFLRNTNNATRRDSMIHAVIRKHVRTTTCIKHMEMQTKMCSIMQRKCRLTNYNVTPTTIYDLGSGQDEDQRSRGDTD
jgi:hypothetical protein